MARSSTGKCQNIIFHGKFWRYWPKISIYNRLYEDLWVQWFNVVLWPLTQDSHMLTNNSSRAIGPIVTMFYVQPPRAEATKICSRDLSHMTSRHANMRLKPSKSSTREPMDWWHLNLIGSIWYSSSTNILQIMTFDWPWPFYGKVKHEKC